MSGTMRGAGSGSLLENAAGAFVVRGFGTALNFAFHTLLARTLGAEGAGLFFLALTLTTLGAVLGRVGTDGVVVRSLAGGLAVGDCAGARGVYLASLRIVWTASALASVVLLLTGPWLAETVFGKPGLVIPLVVLATSLLPLALLQSWAEAFKGLHRARAAQFFQGVAVPLGALCGLSLWRFASPDTFVGGDAGAIRVSLAYAFATGIASVAAWLTFRSASAALSSPSRATHTRAVLEESLPLWAASAGRFALQWTGILVLGALGSSADVGIFGVATRVALVSNLILTAVNTAAAPRFAALHRRGDRAGLERIARRSAALLAVATAPVLGAMLWAPDRLMALFGAEFASHGSVLVILALGQAVNLASGSVGQILVMTGHSREVRQTVLGAAAVNLLLSLILIPRFGALGAAVASGVALAGQNGAAALLVWRNLGIAVVPLPSRVSRHPERFPHAPVSSRRGLEGKGLARVAGGADELPGSIHPARRAAAFIGSRRFRCRS